jgi:WD40 repeat protein
LQIWDAGSGVLKEQRSLPMCDELITPAVLAAFSPGGEQLAGRTRDNPQLVKTWSVKNGLEIQSFGGHSLPVLVVRFNGDGSRLVTCGCDLQRPERDHEIKVWDTKTGVNMATLTGQGLLVSAAFSPDSRWLALGGENGVIVLADWAKNQVARFAEHKSHVAAVGFSWDGHWLASAGLEDRQLKIWNMDGFDPASAAKPLKVSTLLAQPLICDLAFTPDGKRLAAISRDLVKMWDVSTHHEVIALRGAPQRHWDPSFNPRVVFSPDGKRLVGTNWNESISMWDSSDVSDEDSLIRFQLTRRQAADARAEFWHLQEAEECWLHNDRPAANFHFQRLGNSTLPEPLQAMKERLALELGK